MAYPGSSYLNVAVSLHKHKLGVCGCLQSNLQCHHGQGMTMTILTQLRVAEPRRHLLQCGLPSCPPPNHSLQLPSTPLVNLHELPAVRAVNSSQLLSRKGTYLW